MKKLFSRRQALRETAGGLGAVALGWMLDQNRALGATAGPKTYDLTPKAPHFPARAKNVIFIYISGGPSTIDMFDPKPELMKYNGKPAPFEIKGRALNGSQQIMATPWPFRQHGASGRPVSELLPGFAKVVDEVAFVRSMTTDRIDHSTARSLSSRAAGLRNFPASDRGSPTRWAPRTRICPPLSPWRLARRPFALARIRRHGFRRCIRAPR
jgi:hypothetical protein